MRLQEIFLFVDVSSGINLIFSTDAIAMKVFADQNVNWKIRAS